LILISKEGTQWQRVKFSDSEIIGQWPSNASKISLRSGSLLRLM
jgi:hypothetical protein